MGWLSKIFQWLYYTIKGIIIQLRLVWRLTWDRRVSIFIKPLVLGPILYALFSSRGLIPNALGWGIIGRLDDLLVFYLLFRLFILLSPAAVVAEHLREMSSPPQRYEQKGDYRKEDVIEGSYRKPDQESGPPDQPGKPKDT